VTITPTPTLVNALSILFSDTTLNDGYAGSSYSDFLLAKTFNGLVVSSQAVYYNLFGNLPGGVSFNQNTGVLSGIIAKEATAGIYPLTIAAYAQGYATQILTLNWKVWPYQLPVILPTPIPTATATLSPNEQLSILFTDTTLVTGVVGRTYRDYVLAKSFSGTTFTDVKVTYAMSGALPTGLSFSSTTGFITGIISKSALPATYKIIVSAFAKGYPTQIYPYDFVVRADGATAVVTPTPKPTVTATSPAVTSKAILMSTVWFDLGKSLLTAPTKVLLNNLIDELNKSKFTKLQVNGFTDAVKGQPHPTLSLARANAVRSYILARTTGIAVSADGLGLATSSANSINAMQESRKAEIWVS